MSNEAQITYNILKSYLDEMWVEGLEITPLSLEAYYQHKGSKLAYSHAVLEATIALWKAYNKLEVACRNQWRGASYEQKERAKRRWEQR